MTRAQIADPDLVAKLRSRPTGADPAMHPVQPDVPGARRPQSDRQLRRRAVVRARDRGPRLVRADGRAAPSWSSAAGVAGLETARVAAIRGHGVMVVETDQRVGGMAAVAGPGGPLAAWLEAECRRLGVDIADGYDVEVPSGDVDRAVHRLAAAAGATTRSTIRRWCSTSPTCVAARRLPPTAPIALFDPIGGPIAVALAEELGDRAILITQDHIAGNELSRTGDLAPANVRLAQRGVTIERRSLLRAVRRRRGRARGPVHRRTADHCLRRAGRLRLPSADRSDSPAPTCRRAIASRRARSTRPSSKAAALRLAIDNLE